MEPTVVPAAPAPRHPFVWAVLYFPFGLTFGFPSIALGYLASRAGVSVSTIAGVIGMTWLASGWKFTWAPLAAILWLCSLALNAVEEPPRHLHGGSVAARAADAWRELVALVRSRAGRIGLILAILPIGTGAAQALFGSIASEWHAGADTVSAVRGVGRGIGDGGGFFAGRGPPGRAPQARACPHRGPPARLPVLRLAPPPRDGRPVP